MIQISWNIIGHARAKRLLETQIKLGSLSHAYLFLGPDGVGKRSLAVEFAAHIAGSAHDVLVYDASQASVQELRAFMQRLSLRPFADRRQVAIVDGVETMSPSMSNALLKILEEPPLSTVLILISNSRNLLPTIVSRCRQVLFGHLSASELSSVCLTRSLSVAPELIGLTGGSAAQLVRLGEDASSAAQYAQWQRDWGKFIVAPVWRRLALVPQWAEADEAVFTQRLLSWIAASRAQSVHGVAAVRHLQVLLEAWKKCIANANKKLVLEYISLNV